MSCHLGFISLYARTSLNCAAVQSQTLKTRSQSSIFSFLVHTFTYLITLEFYSHVVFVTIGTDPAFN